MVNFVTFCYENLGGGGGGGSHQLLCYVTTEDFLKISFPLIHVKLNLKLHYHVFAEIRISLNLMFIKLEVTPLSLVHIQVIFGCQIPSPSPCLLEILHFFRPPRTLLGPPPPPPFIR